MHLKTFLFIGYVYLSFTSCSEKIDLNGHYDPNISFQVIDQEKPKDNQPYFELEAGMEKHDQLVTWLETNNKNWTPTHNTQAGLVIIFQENFRLLLYRNNNFAVVIINDNDDKQAYYKKDFEVGNLSFLD